MVSPADNSIGYRHHASIGAVFAAHLGFSPEVCGAIQLHVDAKRALVAMDASYLECLSQASIDTLAEQGGPLTAAELDAFHATPGADVALRLRRYDDLGKEPGLKVKQVDDYRDMIIEHLRSASRAL